MWLINIDTLALEEFFGEQIPPYCILSHRWTGDEATFQDFRDGDPTDRKRQTAAGYLKVANFCKLVKHEMPKYGFFRVHERRQECISRGRSRGNSTVRVFSTPGSALFKHVWVDTCCINKQSSAELSEAINSMYDWYAKAFCCFVYLADVPSLPDSDERQRHFCRSQWFTRGWTLQELLAPNFVIFCDQAWSPFGWAGRNDDRDDLSAFSSLTREVAAVTGISEEQLSGRCIRSTSIAEKMSWAATRTTSREEDQAYCLLGILGVNMPLLYGEGRKAFQRLQSELIKISNDQSIFAFDEPDFTAPEFQDCGMLASSPQQFRNSGAVRSGRPCPPYDMTNRGLRFRTEYIKVPPEIEEFGEMVLVPLNCFVARESTGPPRRNKFGGLEPPLIRSRNVFVAWRKHDEVDQWYRAAWDWLGVPRANVSDFYQKKLIGLVKEGQIRRERTFYVDAFRQEHY